MNHPLSAHIGYLFTDLPLPARVAAAQAAGFDAIEHPAPFDIPASDWRVMLDDHGLRFAQMSSGMGGPGEKGLASLPGREAEFHDGFARALDFAEMLGCPFLHPMAGVNGTPATYRANIATALRLAEGRPVQVLVEAISAATVPGYMMATIDDLLDLSAAHPALRVLVDTFHARACGVDPAQALRRAGAALGHVHVADHPGRGQPGTGSIDFGAVRTALSDIGYAGAIGFEYIPQGPAHLGWMQDFRRGQTTA